MYVDDSHTICTCLSLFLSSLRAPNDSGICVCIFVWVQVHPTILESGYSCDCICVHITLVNPLRNPFWLRWAHFAIIRDIHSVHLYFYVILEAMQTLLIIGDWVFFFSDWTTKCVKCLSTFLVGEHCVKTPFTCQEFGIEKLFQRILYWVR